MVPTNEKVCSQALNVLAVDIHNLMREKGFYDPLLGDDVFIESACNNLHDEVSELHEAWRNNKISKQCDKEGLDLSNLEEELADIIIRTLDTATRLGVDIGFAVMEKHRYNATRPYRHGGKRS